MSSCCPSHTSCAYITPSEQESSKSSIGILMQDQSTIPMVIDQQPSSLSSCCPGRTSRLSTPSPLNVYWHHMKAHVWSLIILMYNRSLPFGPLSANLFFSEAKYLNYNQSVHYMRSVFASTTSIFEVGSE